MASALGRDTLKKWEHNEVEDTVQVKAVKIVTRGENLILHRKSKYLQRMERLQNAPLGSFRILCQGQCGEQMERRF
jgi:hypothetical protein